MARSFGAIAQLGERVNGIHEVGSSILPGSTISQSDPAHTLSKVWRPPPVTIWFPNRVVR